MSKESVNKRVQDLVNDVAKGNTSKFARVLGYDHPSKLNRIIREEGTTPSFQILKDIADNYPKVNLNWLITGDGEMYGGGAPVSNNVEELQKEIQHLRAENKELNLLAKSAISLRETSQKLIDSLKEDREHMRKEGAALHKENLELKQKLKNVKS